jgi:hypothetical protein
MAMSFIATFVGLPISLLGFYYTLKQLRAVKSAADAAAEAVGGIKLRFQHFDVIQECARAESALAALRDNHASEPRELLNSTHRIAIALINIVEQMPGLSEETARQLDAAIARANAIARLSQRSTDGDEIMRAKVQVGIQEIHRALVKIRMTVQREQT